MTERVLEYSRPLAPRRLIAAPSVASVLCFFFLFASIVMFLSGGLHNTLDAPIFVPWCVIAVAAGAALLAARESGPDPVSGRYPRVRAALVLLLVGLALGGLTIAGVVFGEDPHVRGRCQRNLRGIGQAVRIYAIANGGAFPSDLPALVLSENLEAGDLLCRNTKYVYVGQSLIWPPAPNAVIAYEPLSNHGNGMSVLFGDGSVRWLSKGQARALLKTLPPPPVPAPATTPGSSPG